LLEREKESFDNKSIRRSCMETGLIIKELREKNHLSQDQLAEKIMVTRQAVSRWETGATVPNTETLKLLSRELDVSINTLLGSPRQLFCQCCGMPLNEDGFISKEMDGSFVAGCTYRLTFDIYVDSGYIFADELVMQLNGDASLVVDSYYDYGYAEPCSVVTKLPAPAEFFTFASGADTTYVFIDETNGCFVFKAGAKTADEVIALFADANISITKAAGTAVTGTAKVGTTCIITSTINGESKSLTVVVVGDVNGDGSINSMDYSKINQVAKNKSTITDAAVLYAANTSPTSSNINSLDISRLTSFMKKKITNF
jgi:DNA-binding XRE family transcriptional regulator